MPLTYFYKGKLLDHIRICRKEASEMLVTYLGVGPTDVAGEVADTICAHVRFKFLEELYKDHLQMVVDVGNEDMHVEYH